MNGCRARKYRSSCLYNTCSLLLNHLPIPGIVCIGVLMMHHDGLRYDMFIHVHTAFQLGSSQLSSFVSPLPPHSPLFLPGSWPSTILSILHVLLGLFTGAWGMVYLQGACASSRDCTTEKKVLLSLTNH